MTTYEKIKALCENAGFSVSSISQHIPGLSVNKASVTGWKNGSVPRPDKIKAIADFFGVSPSYLLSDSDPEQTIETPSHPADSRFSKEDSDLAFALWGDSSDIDEKDIEDVKRFAAFIKEKKQDK